MNESQTFSSILYGKIVDRSRLGERGLIVSIVELKANKIHRLF